ncbi:putative hydro-lyase [Pigmentiphaga aceris]|uniref:putative hydro-lyase n=1 Tax=Pigmentiphaga aceris TaxID=1940612 RepID=UPI003CCC7FBF
MSARSDLPFIALSDAHQARLDARSGRVTGPTANLAPGHVQANLAILPAALADDFLRFCQRNPKSCPLLAVSEPGNPSLNELGVDIDIRSDIPRYRVWHDGVLVDEPTDVRDIWRDDLVSFLIGCSFSFEEAMLDNGLPVRHIEQGRNVPMYRTNVPTVPAGVFSGPMVVSMRPMKVAEAIRAIQVTSRFPSVHGAPVHFGDPSQIGIADIHKPEYGDAVDIGEDEIPVFWACGVTPQSVVASVRPEFCITHAPGHMLVTDLVNSRLAAF